MWDLALMTIFINHLLYVVIFSIWDRSITGKPWKKIVKGVHVKKEDIYLFTWDEHRIKMVSREAQTKKSKPFQVEGQSNSIVPMLEVKDESMN
jgi:hypothetical protein